MQVRHVAVLIAQAGRQPTRASEGSDHGRVDLRARHLDRRVVGRGAAVREMREAARPQRFEDRLDPALLRHVQHGVSV